MTESDTSRRVRPRLLVERTLREGWRLAIRDVRQLAPAMVIPFVISATVASLLSTFDRWQSDGGMKLLVAGISSVPLAALEVGTYRRFLLHTEISWRDILLWSRAHSLVVGWNVAVSAALALPSIGVPPSLETPASFAAFYLVVRFAFVLPAAAAGELGLLPLAWQRSQNNGWRLVLLDFLTLASVALVLLPILVPAHLLHVSMTIPIQLCLVVLTPVRAFTTALAFDALVEHAKLNAPRTAN